MRATNLTTNLQESPYPEKKAARLGYSKRKKLKSWTLSRYKTHKYFFCIRKTLYEQAIMMSQATQKELNRSLQLILQFLFSGSSNWVRFQNKVYPQKVQWSQKTTRYKKNRRLKLLLNRKIFVQRLSCPQKFFRPTLRDRTDQIYTNLLDWIKGKKISNELEN